jgi:hypothetical protein
MCCWGGGTGSPSVRVTFGPSASGRHTRRGRHEPLTPRPIPPSLHTLPPSWGSRPLLLLKRPKVIPPRRGTDPADILLRARTADERVLERGKVKRLLLLLSLMLLR